MASFLRDGLVYYWRLNEAAGSDRVEEIAGKDLDEIGGTVAQGSPLLTGSVNSAEFTGSGAFLAVTGASEVNLGSGSFTLVCRLNIDATTTVDQGVMAKFQPTGSQRQFTLFYFNTEGNLRFGVSSDGADDFSISDTLTNLFGVSYLACAWYDGSDDTVNIQVTELATDTLGTINSAAGPTVIHSGTASLDVGRFDVGVDRIFDGRIDEAMIYDRVLNQDEKLDLLNGTLFEDFVSAAALDALNLQTQGDVPANSQKNLIPESSPRGILRGNLPIQVPNRLVVASAVPMKATVQYRLVPDNRQ